MIHITTLFDNDTNYHGPFIISSIVFFIGALESWNRKGVSEYSGSESIEMVWACEKNGQVPYVQKGAEVSEGRVRGRPRLGWMDGVNVALGNRGMRAEAAWQCTEDWKEWSALVHM